MLVFDTSVIINIERREKKTLEKLLELSKTYTAPGSIAFMTYFEFVDGIRYRSPQNKEKALAFIELFHFLEPTKKTANILSELKQNYDKKGKVFTLSDLLIASQSIENNLILITKDKQFNEIEELKKIVI